MSMTQSMIQENLDRINNRVIDAAHRSGRTPSEILVVAVTKTQSAETLELAYNAGVRVVGENRVQEVLEKWPNFEQKFEWHLIGHLQTNKVKYIVDKVDLIHSLDSLRLADEISKQAVKIGRIIPVLVQINVDEEDSKFGIKVEDVDKFINAVSALPGIKVCGLMNIAPFSENDVFLRKTFKKMKEIFESLKNKAYNGVDMTYLSMGMTHDFEIAIEEGANVIRVGTGIFGTRS